MTSRLEMLFSPDRLRQNWQTSLPSVVATTQNTANLNIHLQYLELQRLVSEEYPDIFRLPGLFQDLTEKIELAFGLDNAIPADAKQKQFIVNLLEELEELLSAADLFQRMEK